MHTADDIILPSERLVPPARRGDRAFRLALAGALLAHAALFAEVGRSVPRTIGDRSGSPDAIAVDIVTAADLESRETVALPAPGAPAPPPQPAAEPAPQPLPQPQPEAAQPPAPKAEPRPEPAEKQAAAPLPDFLSEVPELATLPKPSETAAKASPPAEPAKRADTPTEKPADTPADQPAKAAEKAPPAKKAAPQPQKQARLDPRPPDLSNAPPGRSAAATRPPGITRSGENDAFGREVIRALRQTMPPPRGIYGRVTVRLILNENGDLAEVRMLAPSGTPLDQSVVFATKQTYFPLPPYKSTVADRTFTITYVYR